MKHYEKAVDFMIAMRDRCYWIIPRQDNWFECQFDQMNGHTFNVPCSEENYMNCPKRQEGERIRRKRGF